METFYQTAQNVVAQLPILMSDDEVVEEQHYETPRSMAGSDEGKKGGAQLPGRSQFSNPPANSPKPGGGDDIGDRIMQEEIPLKNRDEQGLNKQLEVHFLDIFAEPEPTLHSIDCLWTNSFRVFEITRLWAYRILTIVLGLPVAFVFGILYAFASFNYIWCFHPMRRLVLIEYSMIKQLVYGAAGLVIKPIFMAIGSCWSNIRVHRSEGQYIKEEPLLII